MVIRCRVQDTSNQDAQMVEYGHKIEEKVKAMQSEIKINIQLTNSEGTQINDLDRRKKQDFKNMMRGLGTSGAILNVPTSESQGYQKEKNKSKKLKTYLKKNKEGKLPQSGKENRHASPGSSQSPKQVGSKEKYTKTHHN